MIYRLAGKFGGFAQKSSWRFLNLADSPEKVISSALNLTDLPEIPLAVV